MTIIDRCAELENELRERRIGGAPAGLQLGDLSAGE